MAGPDEATNHRLSHMAETDKSDPQGVSPLLLISRDSFRAMPQVVSKTHWDVRHTEIV
jgi:hypothetical protein